MRIAALDLGSNTSLLLIVEVESGRIARVLRDETEVTKMGQGVHAAREFHPDALERVEKCLARYATLINEYACDKVVAVATSAARDARNGSRLLAIAKRHGIPVHIISGDQEAQLTFRGALCDRAAVDGTVVIDVGGGSTEVISMGAGKAAGVSVDVGSVRLTELFDQTGGSDEMGLARLRDYAAEAFRTARLPAGPFAEGVAVAGTPTTLAALDQRTPFREEKIHGYVLRRSVVDDWIRRLARMPLAERENLSGMQPKRADVIVAGSLILAQAMRSLGLDQVTVSTRGVRYGVVLAWRDF